MIIDDDVGEQERELLDTKMTWRRRMGVRVFKNRGDVGPQKLYINPHLAPIKESYQHQRKFKRLFVDKELNFEGVTRGTCVGSSVLWIIKTSESKTIDTAIRFALEPLFHDDLGNTRGIIMKYDFKHPIWFNVVHSTKGPDGLISDLNVESEPERFWQNCVIDWYEMRQYVDTRLKIVPTPEEMLPIDPLTALNRINRPRVKLFADGRLLDEESEFIYLTEIST